jgi:2-desacetyl-2-hydroxyethyl bacteriochlorophyllide A dehydrogenase
MIHFMFGLQNRKKLNPLRWFQPKNTSDSHFFESLHRSSMRLDRRMHSPSAAKRLVFIGKQQVILETFELGVPGPGKVRVRIHFSLMSTGTENIVFNRLFDPGTHWDNWVKYPFYPGYSAIGVVETIGERVTSVKPGDRVACRLGHRSMEVMEESECLLVPESIPSEEAAWFALAKITFHGAKAAAYTLGDSVLIVGAGPIGQMSLRWARAVGVADIVVVDSVPDRMEMARGGGATATIVAGIDQARDQVMAACGGKLPRVVIDSTGNAAVFASALSLVAAGGRVVVLGDTGQPARQSLTSDVILRGLTIIGAHDAHNSPEWNNATIAALFFRLAADGRFPLKGLTSHTFKPDQCQEAYETANRDRSKTMGILFDWRTQ